MSLVLSLETLLGFFLASGSMPFGNHGMAAIFLVSFPILRVGIEFSLSSSLVLFVFPLSFHSLTGVRVPAAASLSSRRQFSRLTGTLLSI